MKPLTHFDENGQAHMVDVAAKSDTDRRATASGLILMQASTLALIREGRAKKGDVLGVAQVAALQAAKRTSDLIPLCHPLPISHVSVQFEVIESPPSIRCTATVGVTGKTGVEMEALTCVQVGLLTIYDMVKAADRGMTMTEIRLLEKQGGRSGHWQADLTD